MSNKRVVGTGQARLLQLHGELERLLPHLCAWWDDEEQFVELRLKLMPDATILAIAKGYDSAGGPVVCFGSGYGLVGCLLGVDASIQGGRWRFDKPWEKGSKAKGEQG